MVYSPQRGKILESRSATVKRVSDGGGDAAAGINA